MDDWELEGDISTEFSWGDESSKLKSPSAGRIVWCVCVGIVFSCILALASLAGYTRFIKYPSEKIVDWSTTGMYCLDNWVLDLQSLISVGEESYLHREIEYANGDENKISFYKKMCSTVKYSPKMVLAENVFGNPMINSESDELVYINSYVWSGEEVSFSYIDYSQIDFQVYGDKIKSIMEDLEVSYGCVDYENKLVDVFVQFMLWLPEEDIPIKIIDRVPYMKERVDFDTKKSSFSITSEEDVYIDRLLFSSNDFRDCMDRFSLEAARQTGLVGNLVETDLFMNWKVSENKDNLIRPSQYGYKDCISKAWCGVYFLLNEYTPEGSEYSIPITAEVGDGSIINPLGLGTDIVTSVYFSEYDELGNIVSFENYPIRVTLKEYGISQDAIDYFESKDNRNRGINLKSELQYIYFIFEVTNLSDRELVIGSNMGLCDRNGNVQARTGIIYGLTEEITLQPDETGVIETWQSSTELYKKYVIWGADFARREEPVWFRVLEGNLEDESVYKGVWVENYSE